MSESALAALLRLRESDVVRACGLAAAARGLDLAGRHLVRSGRRAGPRISADVLVGEGDHVAAWLEAADDDAPAPALRWGCSCRTGTADDDAANPTPAADDLACEHVAAVLTAWIRHPGDFTASEPAVSVAPREQSPGASVVASTIKAAPGPASPSPGASLSPWRLPLRDELEHLPEAELRAVAERVLGAEHEPAAERRTVVDRLCAALSDRDQTAHILRRLDAGAVALARAIALLGGGITAAELDGMAQRSGAGRGYMEASVAVLERHGLLFRAAGSARLATPGSDRTWRRFAGWHLPQEVAAALGRALPLPLPPTPTPGAQRLGQPAPAVSGPRHARVQWATARPLCAALALLVHSPPPLRSGTNVERVPARIGPVHSGHARPLPPVPGDPPAVALAAWARGARVPVGLARMARRTLLWTLDMEGRDHPLASLDRLPHAEWPLALRAGFALWLGAETHAELADLTVAADGVQARCDPAHPALRPATLAAENAAARRFVARLLAHAAVGAWLALEQVLDLVWWLDPFFLRGRELALGTPSWWLEDGAGGRPLRADWREEWLRADACYLLALLTGPFHWWGVVDLAGDGSDKPHALRVTPFGAFLLRVAEAAPGAADTLAAGWGAAALATRDGALAVQPLAAGPALLDALAPWTDVTSVAGGRLIVRPSRDRLCRGLDAGLDPAAALAHLRGFDARDHTQAATALAKALDDCRARYGHARLTSGVTLLEADDQATLREALAAAPAVAARARLLAPNVALVPPSDHAGLVSALNRRRFVV